MATSTIEAKIGRSNSSATGTYTTAEWAEGTNTCVWTAPTSGMYIVWASFELTVLSKATRAPYKQLQLRSDSASFPFDYIGYYDTTVGEDSPFAQRTFSVPCYASAGAKIRPYVHTGIAGIVYNVKIYALKVA